MQVSDYVTISRPITVNMIHFTYLNNHLYIRQHLALNAVLGTSEGDVLFSLHSVLRTTHSF